MTDRPTLRPVDGHSPTIAATAWVAPGAVVTGDVTIEAGASIWYNTVLRGDREPIVIGEDTNVQDGCVAHIDSGYPVRLGSGVSVGHGAVVHGCTVEDNCLIGMGAVLLSGSHVGEGSIVAAGAVVREGMRVPAGSLVVGVPAKVLRDVTDEERERVRSNTASYIELRELHRAEDRPAP